MFGRKIVPFDAIIEGAYHDNLDESYIKLARLGVPADVQALSNDGYASWILCGSPAPEGGRPNVFSPIPHLDSSKIYATEDLRWYDGPTSSDVPHPVLEKVRAVIIRDGRVYAEQSIADDRGRFNGWLPRVVEEAFPIFDHPEAEKNWRKHQRRLWWKNSFFGRLEARTPRDS